MRILLWFLYTDELPTVVPDPKLVLAAANEYGLDRLVARTASAFSILLTLFSTGNLCSVTREGHDKGQRSGHMRGCGHAQLSGTCQSVLP